LITEEKVVQIIANACLEEKAEDVVILDVRDLTVIADYFVIASGRNSIQVRSIADAVEECLRDQGIAPDRKEGHQQGHWIIMDYNSVILHVFRREEREYYNLENLWGDASPVAVESKL
jgi:ribosome-associated protein